VTKCGRKTLIVAVTSELPVSVAILFWDLFAANLDGAEGNATRADIQRVSFGNARAARGNRELG
jgi:hypothetical protein